MIAYVDASVLLRLVLGQKNALREWPSVERGVASALVEVECLRVLDRLWLRERQAEKRLLELRRAVFALTASLEVLDVSAHVLSRAAQPLPTALGTLDAIHLSTALYWRDHFEIPQMVMATHDRALASAAGAFGMPVAGA